MTKKITSLVCILALLLGLAACTEEKTTISLESGLASSASEQGSSPSGGSPEREGELPLRASSTGGTITLEEAQAFADGSVDTLDMAAGDWVVFALDGLHAIDEISLQFAGEAPAQMFLTNTDFTGSKNYDQITGISGGNFISAEYLVGSQSAFVKLEIDESLEGAYTLEQAKIDGKPLYPPYMEEETGVVLEANNPENPLSIWGLSVDEWTYTLADEILGDKQNLTGHEKIVIFMDYFATMKVGLSETGSPYEIVKNQIGSCGTYVNLLCALASTQGIKAQLVNLFNYPENQGHTVTELTIDGKQSIYDPTYAAFYTNTPEDTKTPYVFSYEELKSGRGVQNDVVCISGIQDKIDTGEVNPVFLGVEAFMQANPSGPLGIENPYYFPLALNAKTNPKLEKEDFTTAYQGINYIGASAINASHIWTIESLAPGQLYTFRLSAEFIGGTAVDVGNVEVHCFSDSAMIQEGEVFTFDSAKEELVWEIEFIPKDTVAEITLSHDYRGPQSNYASLQSIEVVPLT